MGNVLGNYLDVLYDLFPGINSEGLAAEESEGALSRLRRYLRDLRSYVHRYKRKIFLRNRSAMRSIRTYVHSTVLYMQKCSVKLVKLRTFSQKKLFSLLLTSFYLYYVRKYPVT